MTTTHSQNPRTHILTIALEDYFHAPAFRGVIGKKSWDRLEARYEKSSLAALELLARSNSSATFFVNACVAQRRPELLQEIIRQGQEVALSADGGPGFRTLSRRDFRDELRRSRAIVEDACGHRILGYRRSDVRLRPKHLAALEVLAEEGFLYDSSLTPTGLAFRSQPWRRFVHQHQFGDSTLWEFPLSSHNFGGLMIPFAGGNYFRQYPEAFVRWAIHDWDRAQKHPLVLYFRVWDLDPTHPRIHTGSLMRDLRHYRNSGRMIQILGELFGMFRFNSIAGALDLKQEPTLCTVSGATGNTVASLPPVDSNRILSPISVIVPCHNEEASIPYLVRSLDELKNELADSYAVQFILVDDGSTDKTWELLCQHFEARPDSLLLRHEHNRGVSGAILTGLDHAHEIACSMDCDCSYDPRELKPMLALLAEDADLVVASPYHPEGRVSNVPAWRLLLSRGASFLYRAVTGSKLHTFTSCLRVYRRSAALTVPLKHSGFLGIAELAGRFILDGRRIVEHPATLELRLFGRSKMRIAKTIGGHLHLLTNLAWSRFSASRAPSSLSSTASQPEVDSAKTPSLF